MVSASIKEPTIWVRPFEAAFLAADSIEVPNPFAVTVLINLSSIGTLLIR